MNVQIETAVKRARGYWFVDGFIEIAAGVLFIILAVFTLSNGMYASQATFSSWFISIAGKIAILKLVSFLIVFLLLWWLKDRFTYPRTGRVRGKITGMQILVLIKNLILFLLLPIVGLLIASLLATSTGSVLSSMPVWFPAGLGLLWGILLMLAGEWMGLRRFRWLAVLIFLGGVGTGIWQLTMGLPGIPANIQPNILQVPVLESIKRVLTSLSIILLIAGVLSIFSGTWTFMRYRKENPEPYVEDV